MRAALRGTELYFDVEGAGLVPDGPVMREKLPAFIIHGGPGSDHSGFKPALSPLAEQLQLVYFDHRGQGRSARGDPARYTLDENVEDMEALRRHLGLGPVVSIGTSYGGMVAMAHAARYPAAVSHLVLAVTAAHAGFIDRAQQIVAARGTPEQHRVTATLWAGAFRSPEEVQAFYEIMGPLYSTKFRPEDAAAVRGRADAGDRAAEPRIRARRHLAWHGPAPRAPAHHGADPDTRRPARLDLCTGIQRGAACADHWFPPRDLRAQQPLAARR